MKIFEYITLNYALSVTISMALSIFFSDALDLEPIVGFFIGLALAVGISTLINALFTVDK